jgi:hypothetical protein
MSLTAGADPLLAALQSPAVQAIAWRDHGFRSALGAVGATANPAVAGRAPAQLPAVQPLPEVDVLLALLGDLGTQPAQTTPSAEPTPEPETPAMSPEQISAPQRSRPPWRTMGSGDDDDDDRWSRGED